MECFLSPRRVLCTKKWKHLSTRPHARVGASGRKIQIVIENVAGSISRRRVVCDEQSLRAGGEDVVFNRARGDAILKKHFAAAVNDLDVRQTECAVRTYNVFVAAHAPSNTHGGTEWPGRFNC